MNPPKITRPAIPLVEHTFPAWYQSIRTGNIALFVNKANALYYDKGKGYVPAFESLEHADDKSAWERLPSGTVIEFTQP